MSRLAGFARDAAIAGFFGTGIATDAYAAALRIPNILRNLLGEGTLSASFIPVYSGLLGRGAEDDGRRLAASILGLLAILAALLSGLGVLLAPWITRIIVPGWTAEALSLTVELVRILFPMAGLMILAAWCLGVLNSHRRFFLPFVAPTVWNLSQIAGLFLAWWLGWRPLVVALAWSTLVGAALQFIIQLPTARRLAGSLRPTFSLSWQPVRTVARNFAPVVVGAGVAQLSSFLDVFLASFLVHGAVAALYFAQRLYYLPLGLFGTSVAAASLPELSREAEEGVYEALRIRLARGFRNILVSVLPSCVAFILFGDWIVATLFQRGDFGPSSTFLVHATLAAYAIGLPAASSVKLFASGFHAMLDTRTPVRYAILGLAVGAAAGAALMWPLYAPGLAVGAALGSWCYLIQLWVGLGRRIGRLFSPADLFFTVKVLGACGLGSALGLGAEWLLAASGGTEASLLARLWTTAGTLAAFGVGYVVVAAAVGVRPAGGLRFWSRAPS